MEVTQITNPFNCKVSSSNGGFWTFVIILAVAAGLYYFWKNRDKNFEFQPSKLF